MTEYSKPKVTIDLDEYLKLKESLTIDYIKVVETAILAYVLTTTPSITSHNSEEKAREVFRKGGFIFTRKRDIVSNMIDSGDLTIVITDKEAFEKAFKIK